MARPKSDSDSVKIEEICPEPLCSTLEKLGNPAQQSLKIFLNLNDAQEALLAVHQHDWYRYCWWILYERFPAIDIAREPFNRPDFATHRKKARILNFEMDLCKFCFEIYKQKLPYENPLEWWYLLMLEQRQAEVDSLLNPVVTTRHQVIENLKNYIRHLLDRYKVSCKDQERFVDEQRPHRKNLFKCCFNLKEKKPGSKDFRDQYWNPYISLHKDLLGYWQAHPNMGVAGVKRELVYFSKTDRVKPLNECR